MYIEAKYTGPHKLQLRYSSDWNRMARYQLGNFNNTHWEDIPNCKANVPEMYLFQALQ